MPHPSIRFALGVAALCGTLILPPPSASAEAGRSARSERAPVERRSSERASRSAIVPGVGSELLVRSERSRREPGAERRGRSGEAGRSRGGRDALARGRGRADSFLEYRDGRRWDRRERQGDRDGWFGEDRPGVRASRTLTTFDVGDGGGGSSFIVYGAPAATDPALYGGGFGGGGPKIIDVATERLDRRPIGPSGIDVVQTGGAKIIRIAPGYRLADAERMGQRSAEHGRDLGLQPWSSGWLSWCTKTYRSFDPELGTYADRDGTIRFCEAGRR